MLVNINGAYQKKFRAMTKLGLDPITCKASIKKLNTVKWKQGKRNNIVYTLKFSSSLC